MTIKKFQILILAILLFASFVYSQKQPDGLEIIKKVYNRETGNDQTAQLTMTLIDSRGNKRVRTIKQLLQNGKKVEKKIMFFVSPADVRNTSFMNWSYSKEGKSDDQWIYLPALKRVKRISSDSKSDYFMGSDFTYDDLGDRQPAADNHKFLKMEKIGNDECFVIESKPKEEDYMYSKTITWVIKDKWIGKKKEFYDEDGELLKILEVKDYKKINGYWIILHSEMKNVQKKHSTEMSLKGVKINTGITDRQFTERMMKRGI